jgi:hypothetical protein
MSVVHVKMFYLSVALFQIVRLCVRNLRTVPKLTQMSHFQQYTAISLFAVRCSPLSEHNLLPCVLDSVVGTLPVKISSSHQCACRTFWRLFCNFSFHHTAVLLPCFFSSVRACVRARARARVCVCVCVYS